MELVTHYSRSFRRAYERSISEQKYENHHYREDIFKGHNQNCSEFNSYHSHSLAAVNSFNEMRAKDLTVDKKGASHVRQPQHQNNKINGICASRIKQEVMNLAAAAPADENEHSISHHPQPQSQIVKENRQLIAIRRYFCIFCKMDFSHAEDFLDHLELHPNGSFVLVKRDQIHTPELNPKEQQQHHLNHNDNNNSIIDNNHISGKKINNNNISDNENKNRISSHINERFEAAEEEISNLSIIPEMLKNQIKIEPISEDEEEDVRSIVAVNAETSDDNDHININEDEELHRHQLQQQHSTTSSSSVHFNVDGAETNLNLHSPSPDLQTNETGDPNHQLLVLSNPRIGDGPGEYLCNVCHAKFVYKNNLKSHLKRHLGIYPYVCFCGKRYQFKCKLSKHIEQAHAKIKNFKCPVPTCPKKYFTRNDLAFHISVTHQERQEIPCSICQKVFNSQKSLQIHCRKYHRNQES
ncbi:hypothetical protein PVAND_014068 [Polypedilum vanderplanki]|uniref:C2H2-type domain-containing protein n=1 Tax=Polypedilum vanderplanki TaxID=319348 RepID=A0A9J6CR89_POLVA|nr:hypothetical protein PVAND_014068 [Polypedilum vanderplanki]